MWPPVNIAVSLYISGYKRTDKLQFTKKHRPQKEAVLSYKVENQTFIFPDHSKSLMNRPPMTVRFWKWM